MHNITLPVAAVRVSNEDRSTRAAILSETLTERVIKRNGNDNGNKEVKDESRDKSSIG